MIRTCSTKRLDISGANDQRGCRTMDTSRSFLVDVSRGCALTAPPFLRLVVEPDGALAAFARHRETTVVGLPVSPSTVSTPSSQLAATARTTIRTARMIFTVAIPSGDTTQPVDCRRSERGSCRPHRCRRGCAPGRSIRTHDRQGGRSAPVRPGERLPAPPRSGWPSRCDQGASVETSHRPRDRVGGDVTLHRHRAEQPHHGR